MRAAVVIGGRFSSTISIKEPGQKISNGKDAVVLPPKAKQTARYPSGATRLAIIHPASHLFIPLPFDFPHQSKR